MSEAIFSPCRKWRYTLHRKVPVTFNFGDHQHKGNLVQWIGLNPSVADEVVNDNTIRRCINFSSAWGFPRMCMTNLFAWRDTQPSDMKKAEEPVGVDNDKWLVAIGQQADLIIACWGKHGSFKGRGQQVIDLLKGTDLWPKVHVLSQNNDGSPEHPLYLSAKLQPAKFL